MRALTLAVAVLLASPAIAEAPATRATLADASSAPASRIIVDGASWQCEGTECSASGGTAQPAPRACRRFVARVGKVSAFSYKGTELTAEQIAACNA